MNSKCHEETTVEDAREFAREIMSKNDPSHDFYHVERVHNTAMQIASNESDPDKIDLLVLQLSAYFHDFFDLKYEKGHDGSLKEKLEHFYDAHGVSQERRQKISFIIRNLSFRKELSNAIDLDKVSLEFKIVRDSDRLDAIGAVGIARCFGYSCIINRPFYIKNAKYNPNMTADQYNAQTKENTSIAFNHFYEKLLLLKDRMLTTSGREMAEKRHNFMVEYLKNLEEEINLL